MVVIINSVWQVRARNHSPISSLRSSKWSAEGNSEQFSSWIYNSKCFSKEIFSSVHVRFSFHTNNTIERIFLIGHLRSATARYSISSVSQSSLRYSTFAALMSRPWMLQPFWDLIRNMPAPCPQATSSTLWSACIMLPSKSSSYTAP